MSTAAAAANKVEKQKKFQSLNINTIYQGSSNSSSSRYVQPKYGLQSLGKIPTARRAPANLPSLKSENCGNDPAVHLVPAGGSGWAAETSDKVSSAESDKKSKEIKSEAPKTWGNVSEVNSSMAVVTTAAASVTPSTVVSSSLALSPSSSSSQNILGQVLGRDFPSLNQKDMGESKYGPGPSLRPQTFGNWGVVSSSSSSNSKGIELSESERRSKVSTQQPKFDVSLKPQSYSYSSSSTSLPRRPIKLQTSATSSSTTHRPELVSFSPPSIIDKDKLKGMDDMESNDEDWTKGDETFDYNKKLASDDEESPSPWRSSDHHHPPPSLPPPPPTAFIHRVTTPPPSLPPSLPPVSIVPSDLFLDEDETLARLRKNEEVLKNIERARKRREEEDQKYYNGFDKVPTESSTPRLQEVEETIVSLSQLLCHSEDKSSISIDKTPLEEMSGELSGRKTNVKEETGSRKKVPSFSKGANKANRGGGRHRATYGPKSGRVRGKYDSRRNEDETHGGENEEETDECKTTSGGWFLPRGQPSRRGRGRGNNTNTHTAAATTSNNSNNNSNSNNHHHHHHHHRLNYDDDNNKRDYGSSHLEYENEFDKKKKIPPPSRRFFEDKRSKNTNTSASTNTNINTNNNSTSSNNNANNNFDHHHRSQLPPRMIRQRELHRNKNWNGGDQIVGSRWNNNNNSNEDESVQTRIFENTNYRGKDHQKSDGIHKNDTGLQINFKPNEDSADLKLDFTFQPSEMDDVKPESRGHHPSTDDLNLKIASVKKVWDTNPSGADRQFVAGFRNSDDRSENNSAIAGKRRQQSASYGPNLMQNLSAPTALYQAFPSESQSLPYAYQSGLGVDMFSSNQFARNDGNYTNKHHHHHHNHPHHHSQTSNHQIEPIGTKTGNFHHSDTPSLMGASQSQPPPSPYDTRHFSQRPQQFCSSAPPALSNQQRPYEYSENNHLQTHLRHSMLYMQKNSGGENKLGNHLPPMRSPSYNPTPIQRPPLNLSGNKICMEANRSDESVDKSTKESLDE